MSNNTNAKVVTAESVVAQAVEEKLVVPSQPEGEKADTVEDVPTAEEKPELEVIEGGKKTLKERVTLVTDKLKENKKVLMAVGAGAGTALVVGVISFAKFAAKKAAETVEEQTTSNCDDCSGCENCTTKNDTSDNIESGS